MGALKVYEVDDNPLVPRDVADVLHLARNDRQPNVVVVAESRAEALRALDAAGVSFAKRDVQVSDEAYPPVAALRAAGQLDRPGVLACPSYTAARVARWRGHGDAAFVGWVLWTSNSESYFVEPTEAVTQGEVDALALVLGGPGCQAEALRVLAAGYRRPGGGGR